MFTRFVILGIFAIAPFFAFASSLHIGDPFFLKGNEKTDDDVYVIAPSAVFAGDMLGDAFSVSQRISNQGTIGSDALFLGEKVELSGEVKDDARIIGAEVVVNGSVGDDAVLLGSTVSVASTTVIGGDLYVLGGEVRVAGAVGGNVFIVAHRTTIDGTIHGDLEVRGDVILEKGANISGNFIYHAKEEISIPQSGVVGGDIIFDQRKEEMTVFSSMSGIFSGIFSIQILMTLALGFFLLFWVRERTQEVLEEAVFNFWRRALRGALIVVLVPFFVLVLLFSVVGLPLAIVLLALFISGLVVAMAGAGLLLGVWIERFLFKKPPFPLWWRPVLVGIISLSLVSVIPYIGAIITLVLSLAVFGGAGTVFYRHLKNTP